MKSAKCALVREAEEVDCGNFSLTVGEIDAIRTEGNAQLFDIIGLAFRCGFVKGQRAAKARKHV